MTTTRLPRTRSRRRWVALGAALAVAGSLMTASPAEARPWPGHPDRSLVSYIVRPGDTASGLSVRYHAWTREFIKLNGSLLRVGDRVTIPVVVSAARKHRTSKHKTRPKSSKHKTSKPRVKKHRPNVHGRPLAGARWRHANLSRTQIRDLIGRQAKRRGVPVRLAQAIGWQESGWRQPLVSSAGAIGAMQILPSTGTWMSGLAGKRLYIRDTHGNVRAGTLLLRTLLDETRSRRAAVAAYYEGLGGIQDGWYDETKRYVRSVMAIKRQLDRTGRPTG
ncbi:MAG: hypothetical protein EON48_18745 [Acetobacteraceae bacterium]|nr:MAG: hypothetical protein EON48_18745 [Acetobacteraceae bacterium]